MIKTGAALQHFMTVKENLLRTNHVITLVSITVLLLAASALAPASARPTGISEVPNGCVCHSGSPAEDVQVTLDGVPQSYAAGDEFTLTVTIAGGPDVTIESVNQGGFNLVASGGTLAPTDNTTQIMDGEATHTAEGNDQRSWQVNWTAPSDDSQDITFTAHGNSVNGDGSASSEDHWNKVAVTLDGVTPPSVSDDSQDITPGFGLALTLLTLVGVAASRARKIE
jgi:hypothetical protein